MGAPPREVRGGQMTMYLRWPAPQRRTAHAVCRLHQRLCCDLRFRRGCFLGGGGACPPHPPLARPELLLLSRPSQRGSPPRGVHTTCFCWTTLTSGKLCSWLHATWRHTSPQSARSAQWRAVLARQRLGLRPPHAPSCRRTRPWQHTLRQREAAQYWRRGEAGGTPPLHPKTTRKRHAPSATLMAEGGAVNPSKQRAVFRSRQFHHTSIARG